MTEPSDETILSSRARAGLPDRKPAPVPGDQETILPHLPPGPKPVAAAPSPPVAPPSVPAPATIPFRPDRLPRSRKDGSADAVPLEWRRGDVVLGIYEVVRVLGEGGMGVVLQVHHRAWDLDMAVKCPRGEFFAMEGAALAFTREAENWVNIGMHPHVVSCYYVRVLGGIPRLFAEFVNGHDLSDWIGSGMLYYGGTAAALERILDVSIQFAWGLLHAHQQELIHRDVKPANVMMTEQGLAKVTDFGLAQAVAAIAEPSSDPTRFACTPAYASPEQLAKQELNFLTDLWSWAVSVLQMFTIYPPEDGRLAAERLEGFQEYGPPSPGPPAMPPPLVDLLRACFAVDPDRRPRDMAEAAATLIELYRYVTGRPYPRRWPSGASLRADGLNNRAVSLVDLGRIPESIDLLSRATAEDPHHVFATYNLDLLRWHTGERTDVDVLHSIRDMRTPLGRAWILPYLTAQIHLERGDPQQARRALLEAQRCEMDAESRRMTEASLQSLPEGCELLPVLQGHNDAVTGVASTRGGHVLASGSRDRTVRVWQIDSGACVRVLRGHRDAVTCVAVTPDGRFVVSGSEDGTLALWETHSGACRSRMVGHQGAVTCVALAMEGGLTVSGGADGTVRLWETASGRGLGHLTGPGPVGSLAASADGSVALSGHEDGTLCRWKLPQGQPVIRTTAHSGGVHAVAMSPDGSLCASGGSDGAIRLWDARLNAGSVLRGHSGAVTSLALGYADAILASGGADTTVRLWELATGHVLRTLEGDGGRVLDVAAAVEQRLVMAATANGAVRVWHHPAEVREAQPMVVRPHASEDLFTDQSRCEAALQGAIRCLESGDAAGAVAALTEARSLPGFERAPACLSLWSAAAGYASRGALKDAWLSTTLLADAGRMVQVALAAGGRVAAAATADGTLRAWDLETMHCQMLQAPTGLLAALALDRRGSLLAAAGRDPRICLWDLATGASRYLEGHRAAVVALAMAGNYVLSASRDGTLRLWDAQSGRCLLQKEGQGTAVAVTADVRWLAWGGGGGAIQVWDLDRDTCLARLRDHTDAVQALAFTGDRRYLVSASADGTGRVWQTSDMRCIATLKGHQRAVHSVSPAADGRIAATCGRDATIRIWDLVAGTSLSVLEGHTEAVLDAALSADGQWCLSGGADGTVRLWYLDWELVPWTEEAWKTKVAACLDAFLASHPPTEAGWSEADLGTLQEDLLWQGCGGMQTEDVWQALMERCSRRG